jgi:hypothetical protein
MVRMMCAVDVWSQHRGVDPVVCFGSVDPRNRCADEERD